MYLFLSIFIFLVLVQFILGIFASLVKRGLKNKYSYYLGEQIEFNILLQNAKEENPDLGIEATDQIEDVCIAENNLIIVNKGSIYSKDMYSNLYLLFQLKLTNPKFTRLRTLYNYQSILFLSQVICLILVFLIPDFSNPILVLAFVIFLLTLMLITYGIVQYGNILNTVLKEAKGKLKLDDVEQARAETLAAEIKYEILSYPLEIPWRLTRFWS